MKKKGFSILKKLFKTRDTFHFTIKLQKWGKRKLEMKQHYSRMTFSLAFRIFVEVCNIVSFILANSLGTDVMANFCGVPTNLNRLPILQSDQGYNICIDFSIHKWSVILQRQFTLFDRQYRYRATTENTCGAIQMCLKHN